MMNKGSEVQKLLTDQGTEYRSNKIRESIRTHGINHVPTGRAVYAQMNIA